MRKRPPTRDSAVRPVREPSGGSSLMRGGSPPCRGGGCQAGGACAVFVCVCDGGGGTTRPYGQLRRRAAAGWGPPPPRLLGATRLRGLRNQLLGDEARLYKVHVLQRQAVQLRQVIVGGWIWGVVGGCVRACEHACMRACVSVLGGWVGWGGVGGTRASLGTPDLRVRRRWTREMPPPHPPTHPRGWVGGVCAHHPPPGSASGSGPDPGACTARGPGCAGVAGPGPARAAGPPAARCRAAPGGSGGSAPARCQGCCPGLRRGLQLLLGGGKPEGCQGPEAWTAQQAGGRAGRPRAPGPGPGPRPQASARLPCARAHQKRRCHALRWR